ncbi:peptidylprolyl isomerase [Litorimonas sp. RW-G-Af-16]|uniref:peptidylprolyl isomerase n=1 Tax=Litorimonas sp. RW-G-Af-16 TaxID=3241168 RepID=UPI003AAA4472
MKNLITPALLSAIITLSACADKRPNVIFETDLGQIEIEVYQDKAPISAADFLYYVDEGLYDNEGFYRVVNAENDPRGMGMSLIQGGRLDMQKVTSSIAHERMSETGLLNSAGSVSIARDEPGTGSAAYFFINIGDNNFLDYGGERNPDGEGYASFGRIVSGMDTVVKIQSQETAEASDDAVTRNQMLVQPVRIKRAYRK